MKHNRWFSYRRLATCVATLVVLFAACAIGGASLAAPASDEVLNQVDDLNQARNSAAGVAALAKSTLKGQQLADARTKYMDLQGAANSWLDTLVTDIRNGHTGNEAHQKMLGDQVASITQRSNDFVAYFQPMIVAMANTAEKNSTASGHNVSLEKIQTGIQTSIDIVKAVDGIVGYFAEHRKQVLAMQAAEREDLALKLGQCSVWPLWDDISAKGYIPACMGGMPSPVATPKG